MARRTATRSRHSRSTAKGASPAAVRSRTDAARGNAGGAPGIAQAEFAARRERVLKELKGAVGLVMSGEADASLHDAYQAHAHFRYLTGVCDEPGAMLLLDSTNPVPARRAILLLRPLNPELEKWEGFRHELGSALRERTGFAAVMRTTMLPRLLLEAARRSRRLACLMPLAAYNAPVSGDLEVLRRQAERVPGCVIEDRSSLLMEMRAAKSPAEIACIEHAGRITAAGFDAVLRGIRPGMSEFDVQELAEHGYRTHGASQVAYRTIAGTGFNATVLHYHANCAPLQAGELLVLDSAAKFAGYSADVTRTYPVSGRFTPRQRELYDLVLKAQLAAIAATRAGATLAAIDQAARSVISDAGYGDAFIHGTGHHLGLETHDASPDAPLADGAVVTIEPGIYLPGEKLGIRIEDDVVATRRGPRVLTDGIPKTASEIERAMSAR